MECCLCYRPAYFHRDVHINNIFVPCTKDPDDGKKVYGNARLMVTHFTKAVFDENNAMNSVSICSVAILIEVTWILHIGRNFTLFNAIYKIHNKRGIKSCLSLL